MEPPKEESPNYGFSNWFRKRLNVETDIDAIASSPPEHEAGFPKEYVNKYDSFTAAKSSSVPSFKEHRVVKRLTSGPLTSLLVDNLDDTCSSTDTTPFVTPQASPLIPRKQNSPILEGKDGSLISNPKKWYLKSILSQLSPDGTSIPPSFLTKENNTSDSDTEISSPTSEVKSPPFGNLNGRKCKISQFELNAISPSSF